MPMSLCTPANLYGNTVCIICGVLCGEMDMQFNSSHVDTLYLFLNNTIARHCISHNRTAVWVVDLQNGIIILSVEIPHNNRHFLSIVNTNCE